MQVNVKVKSVFGVKMFALVVIRIPVPKQTVKQVSKSHQVEQTIMLPIDSLLWKIRKFPGQTKPTMSAEVELISMMAEKRFWMRPPIQMEFEEIGNQRCYQELLDYQWIMKGTKVLFGSL